MVVVCLHQLLAIWPCLLSTWRSTTMNIDKQPLIEEVEKVEMKVVHTYPSESSWCVYKNDEVGSSRLATRLAAGWNGIEIAEQIAPTL